MSANLNKKEKAYELYKSERKLKDIAKELEISEGTLRSWKSREKWDGSKAKTLQQKNATLQRKKATIKNVIEDIKVKEINQVIEVEDLSDKEQLFCLCYIRCFNATKAYMKAYGVKYEVAAVCGCRLLKKEKIKNTIKELKQNRMNRELLSEEDIFQKYMDIAFADISDYLYWGQEEVPVMAEDEETGEKVQLMQKVNVVRFKESVDVDGTLISEVKQGRNGVSIKLADRMKALEWLAEHMDLATEKQKAEISVLRAKIKEDDSDQIENDGFIEALDGKVNEIWQEE